MGEYGLMAKSLNGLIGKTVRLGKGRQTATIKSVLDSIDGGIVLDKPLDGFHCWNITDVEIVEKHDGFTLVSRIEV